MKQHENYIVDADGELISARRIISDCYNQCTLDAIAKRYYFDTTVGQRVARNPKTSAQTLLFLAKESPNQAVKLAVAEQCGRINTSQDKSAQKIICELILKGTYEIRKAIAKNTQDSQLLIILIKHKPKELDIVEICTKRLNNHVNKK